MSKMRYFSKKFSKIALGLSAPSAFNIEDLKFHDLAK